MKFLKDLFCREKVDYQIKTKQNTRDEMLKNGTEITERLKLEQIIQTSLITFGIKNNEYYYINRYSGFYITGKWFQLLEYAEEKLFDFEYDQVQEWMLNTLSPLEREINLYEEKM